MCSVSFPVQNLAHGFRQFCAADGFADETPGIDYGEILRRAEEEADVVVWDGGNNDTPFFRPDVHIVLFDPHRAGHELLYYPGETNLLMAHVAVVNKVDTASAEQVEAVLRNIRRYAPGAEIVLAESPVTVSDPSRIQGRRVLVVEDGPTLTRGEMAFGAGTIAAREFGAARLIDPRPCACGTLKKAFRDYPHMGAVLPASVTAGSKSGTWSAPSTKWIATWSCSPLPSNCPFSCPSASPPCACATTTGTTRRLSWRMP